MSYYAVLGATSALLEQQHFTMKRCMRRFNGPHRYVLFDSQKHAVHFEDDVKNRRMGYTLQELLDWLSRNGDIQVATQAQKLSQRLIASQQLKSA